MAPSVRDQRHRRRRPHSPSTSTTTRQPRRCHHDQLRIRIPANPRQRWRIRSIKVRTASTHPRPTRRRTRHSPGNLHPPRPRRHRHAGGAPSPGRAPLQRRRTSAPTVGCRHRARSFGSQPGRHDRRTLSAPSLPRLIHPAARPGPSEGARGKLAPASSHARANIM